MHSDTVQKLVLVNTEVQQALDENRPIVALESNVIAHGLNYPQNLEVLDRMECGIRQAGAVPATTAVRDGKILVGLNRQDQEFFATEKNLAKVSSRDLSMVLAKGQSAVTTVAATLLAAELAGVQFLASAGIGGVHRGAEKNFDISSDPIQIARSPVVAVTAGAKKILDLALTLEFLETHCVPCVTYRFSDFPAFYVRSSGLPSPCRMDDLTEIAQAIAYHQQFGTGGFIVAAPTLAEHAIDEERVENAIRTATAKASQDGITGKALTKYIMRAVNTATEGQADMANAEVLVSNAQLAAALAMEHAAIIAEQRNAEQVRRSA